METTWTVNDGILTVEDPNTGNTHEVRYRDGRIENRVVAVDGDQVPDAENVPWLPWSYEGVFFAVSAWFDEVVANA